MYGLSLDSVGNLYIVDAGGYRIRMVNTSGYMSTVAGNGTQGYAGDGGPATSADLNFASTVAFDSSTGNFYTGDKGSNVVRMIYGVHFLLPPPASFGNFIVNGSAVCNVSPVVTICNIQELLRQVLSEEQFKFILLEPRPLISSLL